jgi:hypothetical protein
MLVAGRSRWACFHFSKAFEPALQTHMQNPVPLGQRSTTVQRRPAAVRPVSSVYGRAIGRWRLIARLHRQNQQVVTPGDWRPVPARPLQGAAVRKGRTLDVPRPGLDQNHAKPRRGRWPASKTRSATSALERAGMYWMTSRSWRLPGNWKQDVIGFALGRCGGGSRARPLPACAALQIAAKLRYKAHMSCMELLAVSLCWQ